MPAGLKEMIHQVIFQGVHEVFLVVTLSALGCLLLWRMISDKFGG